MSDRPTPETDDAQWGTGKVTTDFARRLERERDEALMALAMLRCKTANDETHIRNVERKCDKLQVARNECERQYQEKVAEIAKLLSERDEAREERDRYKRMWDEPRMETVETAK